ncbi:hypothetical protein QN277_004644 [Acacia crassicarpa]|uniref:Uncharacterized protein n=1 Tax=Acacia crassicarpa TaxID=499986 RepID=A0AAE1J0V9_9FABA|nr:hypothetical protein QN277_004644 [Acacia crassicarpa]
MLGSDQENAFADALFCAVKEGNVGFVFQLSIANSEIMLIWAISFQNIFCYVVDYQLASVFSTIHGLCFKGVVATSKDIHGNTLLYVSAISLLLHLTASMDQYYKCKENRNDSRRWRG